MIFVLDASAALRVAGKYEESVLDRKDVVLVPEIYIAEVTNAVWKNHRILGTPLETCHELLTELLDFPSVVVSGAQLAREALELAAVEQHPVYDLFYLALARQSEATLFTRDKALTRLAHKYKIATA